MQAENTLTGASIRYLKGVGPKKSVYFEKLGINTIEDLLHYLPRRYEDRSRIVAIKDASIGEAQAVVGKVLKTDIFTARTGTNIFEAVIGDDNKRIYAIWYNQPFMKNALKPGDKVVLFGKVELQRHLQMTHPVFELIEDRTDPKESLEIGRIVPIYPLTENITQKYIRKIIYGALKGHIAEEREWLSSSIMARRKLVDKRFALENIHFPHSFDNLKRAYKRLVFEEFFVLQLMLALKRKRLKKKGIQHKVDELALADFEGLFDFTLTSAQKKCIDDVRKDMASGQPMHRLVQGDVGSGKTVVAMYALLVSVKSGYQAALMAPTEVLARQHYLNISKIFMPLGINVQLLVSGMDKNVWSRIRGDISSGEADVIIGTHSLIQEELEYRKLGLVVVDEQHKFGVTQRDALRKKGVSPDMLVMTATPIPRSLVLTFFGDMDVSVLREKPLERGEISTYWVKEDQRPSVYNFVKEEISKGRQAFIVYPRIKKDTEQTDLKSAEEMYTRLKDDTFRGLRVGLLHGRLSSAEKGKMMDGFRKARYDILVATTVIEVGVDVPNATIMLIEHAERYGLAQLHQLRGRIGRGKETSYCILMGEPASEEAFERLSAISEIEDGFAIAEKDLDIRGPGEFLGTRQSGLPEIRVGDIARDFEIMEQAREEAVNIVDTDPLLVDDNNRGIRRRLIERFKGRNIFGE